MMDFKKKPIDFLMMQKVLLMIVMKIHRLQMVRDVGFNKSNSKIQLKIK